MGSISSCNKLHKNTGRLFIDLLLLLWHHERFTLIVLAVCLSKSDPLVSAQILQVDKVEQLGQKLLCSPFCHLLCEPCLIILEAIALQLLP